MGFSRAELIRAAWEDGNLEYKVHDYQLPIYKALWAAIEDPTVLKYILDVSRRFGKTHVSSIIAIEYAIRHPKAQINYATGTNKAMEKILRGIMPVIFDDCPKDLLPKRVAGTWEFPNGSVIYTAGVNNQHADDLRGTSSHLNIVDEAAQIDELKYLVQSVLMPQQLTVGGTMLLLSTPPTQSDHDYADIYRECKEEGHVQTFTIYDNAEVMKDQRKFNAFLKEAGGEDSVTWKREYLAQWVQDTDKPVIPEWSDEFVKETPRPVLYDYYLKYVGMDLGFRDNTSLVFGYVDFARAKFVIERDIRLNGEDVTTKNLAAKIREVEEELGWASSKKPPTRISDNNWPLTLVDLHIQEGILFHPVSKDEREAMINQTRLFINSGKLEVSAAAEYLIACLKFAVWDKNRKEMARSKKYGHYDALDALVYVLRYVDMATNLVPPDLGYKRDDLLHQLDQPGESRNIKGLRELAGSFNRKPVRGQL